MLQGLVPDGKDVFLVSEYLPRCLPHQYWLYSSRSCWGVIARESGREVMASDRQMLSENNFTLKQGEFAFWKIPTPFFLLTSLLLLFPLPVSAAGPCSLGSCELGAGFTGKLTTLHPALSSSRVMVEMVCSEGQEELLGSLYNNNNRRLDLFLPCVTQDGFKVATSSQSRL